MQSEHLKNSDTLTEKKHLICLYKYSYLSYFKVNYIKDFRIKKMQYNGLCIKKNLKHGLDRFQISE